jgi:hypothetical protein
LERGDREGGSMGTLLTRWKNNSGIGAFEGLLSPGVFLSVSSRNLPAVIQNLSFSLFFLLTPNLDLGIFSQRCGAGGNH